MANTIRGLEKIAALRKPDSTAGDDLLVQAALLIPTLKPEADLTDWESVIWSTTAKIVQTEIDISRFDSDGWIDCPVTVLAGLPLKILPVPGEYFESSDLHNFTASKLQLDPDPSSTRFSHEPEKTMRGAVLVARCDGKALHQFNLLVMLDFLRKHFAEILDTDPNKSEILEGRKKGLGKEVNVSAYHWFWEIRKAELEAEGKDWGEDRESPELEIMRKQRRREPDAATAEREAMRKEWNKKMERARIEDWIPEHGAAESEGVHELQATDED